MASDSSNNPDLQQKLAQLRLEYFKRLETQLSEMRALTDRLSAELSPAESAQQLHMLAHKLAGSAGTFGANALSQSARRLEQLLVQHLGADGLRERDEIEMVARCMEDVESLARQAQAGMAESPVVQMGARAEQSGLIYITEDDSKLAEVMQARLAAAGYEVRVCESATALEAACKVAVPDVLILDIALPESTDAGLDVLHKLRTRQKGMAAIVVSVRDDIGARLAALRAGAQRYLRKPLDLEQLAGVVDSMTGRARKERYRVLLVDDEETLLEHNAAILMAANMDVRQVARGLDALAAAREMQPDVIVLDVYMPEVNGLELAALLREDDAFSQTPILFLSAETDLKKQLVALDLGGDEFLVKPVAPDHLVAAVEARAKRSRHMHRMTHDLRRALAEREYTQFAMDQHAIVSVADAAGNIIYVNRKFQDVSGYSQTELIGHNHRMVKSGVHPEAFYREMWDTISSGKVWHGEVCNRRKNGELYWVNSTIVPFLDEQGLPYQYISVRTDITNLKGMQANLQESEDRMRRSQVYANIGTWDWDIQSGDLYWSERIGPLFGYEEGKLETNYGNFLASVHPDDRQSVIDAVNDCVQHGKKYDIEHRCVWPDGSVRWLLERGDVVRDEHGTPLHMLGVVQDITDRKQAELSLREAEARLSFAVEGAGDGVWDWDMPSGRMLLSGNYEGMLGFARGELEQTITAWVESVYPDDRLRVQGVLQEYLAGDLSAYVVELRLRCKDGGWKWVLCRGTVVERDDEGTPRRMIGIHSDIAARKDSELALIDAREEADRANRAKSDFLSSMSHELRTPMNAILGFAQLMEMDAELSPSNQENLTEILKAGHHLLDLINDVLDLAKVEAGRVDLSLEAVACDELFADCVNLVEVMAQERSVVLESCPDSKVVRADRIRLKQVLLNLLSNAIKYNRPGGQVWLEMAEAEDGMARIQVRDTGLGIPQERQADLFQAFNRLGAERGDVEGTGIGLVITRRLVEMMGGNIGMVSAPGEGSTFWIELPKDEISTDLSDAPAHARPDGQAAMHDSVVLYVEDNPANLRLVSHLLGHRPHVKLLTAHTPSLGLDLAASRNPDLILLDINLPGMDGYEVLQRLRAMPHLKQVPVVAVSANAMPQDVARGKKAGFSEYLVKPLDLAHFYRVVDTLLAGADTTGK